MPDPVQTTLEAFFKDIGAYLNEKQVEFVKKAYEFSFQAHRTQVRKSGEPYIIHPFGVATILAELQLDELTLAAAFLHDVVEDTPITLEELKANFGEKVAYLVDGVTKLNKIEYISKEEQQVHNYRKMFLAMAKDIRVVLIKLADRLHNMRTMKYMPIYKQKSISKETIEIYAPLAHRLGIYTIKWELEDLSLRYMDPDKYYKLVEQVKVKRREREEMIHEAIDEMQNHLDDMGVHCEIQGRPKSFYSINKKMVKSHKELNEIYDLLAVRVLVDSVKDCYGVLGVVHNLWRPIPGRFKDYVAVPKSNMYQSLHTTVVFSNGQPLEIQIRTFEMHRISEYGIAAHWRYKENSSSKQGGSGIVVDKTFDAKLSWLRQLLEWHQDINDPHEFVNSVKMDVFSDEVFVFTPRGDVIDLPQGSVPIDFAYRIHTAIGNSCVGSKVNGKIVSLDYELSNGDIVEVITSKQASGPSRDWLNIVGASESRNKIRQWFKKERREDNIIKGREMLEQEMKRLGYDAKIMNRAEKIKKVALLLHLDADESLLAAIGYGGVTLKTVATKLIEIYKDEQKKDTNKNLSELLAELKPRKSKAKSSHGILVKGEEGILVKLAKCCNPVPGDPIVGYITRGRGISIHRLDCQNISIDKEDSDRLIDVSWDIEVDSVYTVSLEIHCTNKTGIMADIMNITSESKININSINAKSNNESDAVIALGIDVKNTDQLEDIINKIRRIKGVYSVRRFIGAKVGQK